MRLGNKVALQLMKEGDGSRSRAEQGMKSESYEQGSQSKHPNRGISRAQRRQGRAEMKCESQNKPPTSQCCLRTPDIN